jgi:hypothetical protein
LQAIILWYKPKKAETSGWMVGVENVPLASKGNHTKGGLKKLLLNIYSAMSVPTLSRC